MDFPKASKVSCLATETIRCIQKQSSSGICLVWNKSCLQVICGWRVQGARVFIYFFIRTCSLTFSGWQWSKWLISAQKLKPLFSTCYIHFLLSCKFTWKIQKGGKKEKKSRSYGLETQQRKAGNQVALVASTGQTYDRHLAKCSPENHLFIDTGRRC